ncbi:hypothetical protein V3C99_005828 [Haemonchus contortus]
MGSLRQKASGADGLRLWVALSAGESVSDSKWILRQAHQFGVRCIQNYDNYRFRSVALEILHFAQRTLSAHYISLVRERLYCSSIGSNDHMSVQFTLHRVGTTMAKCMAPLLPHLAAQFFQHQPNCSEKLILRDVLNFDGKNDIPMHPELDRAMEKIMLLR